jgi:hypothetical protein
VISIAYNPWSSGWSDGHAPPKDQTVAEWCAENVYLIDSPIGAKYQPGGHSDDILNDLQNPDVYESCTVGHTGMGKSAVLECATSYVIAQAPGPTGIIGQTDDTVREWVETRALKAWEKCDAVARLIPSGKDRHDKKKDCINFRHMPLFMGGANLTNTQEKSLRYTFGDEVWAWKPGILGEFLKRHHDRWNRKSLFLAQGGVEGDDWHNHTKDGLGFDRGFTCPACATVQIDKWAQVKFERVRDANDEWDWPAIFESVHYECEHPDCDEAFPDTAQGRRRRVETAIYVCRNNAHIPGRVTRYVPAMSNPRIQLSSLVKEWLLAEDAWRDGDKNPRRQFIQKRLAQFWVEKVETPNLSTGGEAYSKAQYNEGERWEGEHDRDLTIDVQKEGFWARIRAWKIGDGTTSRLLWEGKVDTWQTLFSLQERFGVENSRVFIDGRYRIDDVVKNIYQHCGPDPSNHWIILIGQDNAKGYQFDVGTPKKPRKVWKIFSKWQHGATHTGLRFRAIHFSNLRAKDALASIMELPDGAFGVPVDVSRNYTSQMQSETKREVSSGVWRWEKIKDHFHNHLWDTEVMGVVGASIRGHLKIESVDPS